MEISHVIDALSAAFFALLGIWAAVGRRHWFLRAAVVGAFLLASLLLPAYVVVLEFGLAIALISAGVWIAHGRKKWERRFSLQTIMLVMVVAAVACAVVGSASELSSRQWWWVAGVGSIVAVVGLACLWVVYGTRFKWQTRAIWGLFGFAILFFVSFGTMQLQAVVRSALSGGNARMTVGQFMSQPRLTQWLDYYLWTGGMSVGMVVAVLLLARGSQWFGPRTYAAPPPADGKTIACRTGMVALCLTIFLPLSYLFYRLATPTPFAVVELPTPNAYDDLVAAGQLVPSDIQSLLSKAQSMTAEQLGSELEKLEPARLKLDQALGKEITISRSAIPQSEVTARMQEVSQALSVLALEANYAKKTGDIQRQLEIIVQLSRFWIAIEDGLGLEYSVNGWEFGAFSIDQLHLLSAEQCKELARQLWVLQQTRLSLEERIELMRIVYENHGWLHHLNQLIKEWSGEDSSRTFRHFYQSCRARAGLFITQLAIEAYWREHEELPESLAELVPNYLPSEIQDPFGADPLRYQHWDAGEYVVFSVGLDRKPGEHQQGDWKQPKSIARLGDDISVFGPARPPS